MRHYVKVYMEYFGYAEGDFIPSELSGMAAVDIHHIEARGMGGSSTKDTIYNLMALTREEHIKYGDKKQYKEMLKLRHKEFMAKYGKV